MTDNAESQETEAVTTSPAENLENTEPTPEETGEEAEKAKEDAPATRRRSARKKRKVQRYTPAHGVPEAETGGPRDEDVTGVHPSEGSYATAGLSAG